MKKLIVISLLCLLVVPSFAALQKTRSLWGYDYIFHRITEIHVNRNTRRVNVNIAIYKDKTTFQADKYNYAKTISVSMSLEEMFTPAQLSQFKQIIQDAIKRSIKDADDNETNWFADSATVSEE